MADDLNSSDVARLLALKPDDITRDFIEENFANHFKNGKMVKARYRLDDEFTLKKGQYFNNETILTNVGLFIYNKLIVEGPLEKVLGYINTPINKEVLYNSIEDKISEAILNDVVTPEEFAHYIDKTQWFLSIHAMICCSFTKKIMRPLPKIIKARDEKLSKLAPNDAIGAAKVEKELIDMALKELKGDPGMTIFDSGARGDFNNNYKAINIMKGPMFNHLKDDFKIIGKSFNEGIDKKDIPDFGTSVVSGAYPKAVGTQRGGYIVKQFYASYQGVVLGDKGSDCGSKGYINVIIDPRIAKIYLYRYIQDGKKLVYLDKNTIKSYYGKQVKMRSPMFCCSPDNRCNVCCGDMYYKLGIKNIGLTTAKIGSNLLNQSMKAFHNTTVKTTRIDINKLVI